MGIITQSMQAISRRAFAGMLAGAGLARAFGTSPSRVETNGGHTACLNLDRHYRADAHVLLFGASFFHREGVGGGCVVWREFAAGGPARLLEFNGFSLPERAAGLNRMGFLCETLRLAQSGPGECSYFGLMTSSPEESAEEARRALHSDAKEQTYTAIDGRLSAGETRTTVGHFTARTSGPQFVELEQRARQALAAADVVAAPEPAPEYSQSFMQAIASLLLRPDSQQARYSYSGRRYRLQLTRSRDVKACARFRECGLIRGSTDVVRVSARVRCEADGKETEFRLWIADPAERPLPLRIEYRAKSYLRLVFEAAS
jgi:hypothetical protein